MITNCLKLSNVTLKLSQKHSGFMDVVLNGTDARGHLTKYSFTAEKIHQVSGFCSYLGFNSFNDMDKISELLLNICMSDDSELIAVNTNAENDQNWLLLSTGRVTTLNVINSVIKTREIA